MCIAFNLFIKRCRTYKETYLFSSLRATYIIVIHTRKCYFGIMVRTDVEGTLTQNEKLTQF